MAKILVVDDDRQFRGMLRQMLERANHTVIEVTSGDECISGYCKHVPDLIMLDMMTPGRDGLEVLQELRRDYPGVKVIAMSGGLKGDTSWLEPLVIRLGVKIFLHKPFDKGDMLSAIETLCSTEPTEI